MDFSGSGRVIILFSIAMLIWPFFLLFSKGEANFYLFYFYYFLSVPHSMWCLSSLTRD